MIDLVFNTEKEKRVYNLLKKYLQKSTSEHEQKVESLYKLALENGYNKNEITISSHIGRDYVLRKHTEEGMYVFIYLNTTIKTIHSQVQVKEEFSVKSIESLKRNIVFENSKQKNEDIKRSNQEIDEILMSKK